MKTIDSDDHEIIVKCVASSGFAPVNMKNITVNLALQTHDFTQI